MDLGIAGRRGIVCASSQGLGRACAAALAEEGVHLVVNGRDSGKLEKTAAELRNLPGIDREVVAVAADITTDAGRAALLAACPAPDILVLNNRGPKPGILADQTAENFEEALTLHFRTPLALLMAVLPGMKERGWGRIVCITSAMVTAPEEVQVASASARAAQTALMKAASFDAAAHGVTINFLQPRGIESQRQHDVVQHEAEKRGVSFEEAWARQVSSVAAKRFGKPTEFGKTCAFVCSEHAGYMSGTNLHLEGGTYTGIV